MTTRWHDAVGDRRPKYRWIADDLAERIAGGEFPPGSRLPAEPELMEHYEASSTTVRAAVKSLAVSGLVRTLHGIGTTVVDRTLLRIHANRALTMQSRLLHPEQDTWATDVRAAGRAPTQDLETRLVPVGPQDAQLFGIDPGSDVVQRRLYRRVDGIPVSIESTLYPMWLADEIPALRSSRDITMGTTLLLAHHGHAFGLHREYLSARPVDRTEAQFFQTDPVSGLCVLVVRRESFAHPGEPALRISRAVHRCDMTELVYDIPDDPGQDVTPAVDQSGAETPAQEAP